MWLFNAILIIVAIFIISQVTERHGGEIGNAFGWLVATIVMFFVSLVLGFLSAWVFGSFLAIILNVSGAPLEVMKAILSSENILRWGIFFGLCLFIKWRLDK